MPIALARLLACLLGRYKGGARRGVSSVTAARVGVFEIVLLGGSHSPDIWAFFHFRKYAP